MTKGKKAWLTAGLAAIAAAMAALAPATAPLVEAAAAGVARALIGSEQEPAVARPGHRDPAEAERSAS